MTGNLELSLLKAQHVECSLNCLTREVGRCYFQSILEQKKEPLPARDRNASCQLAMEL